jgi:hypothetical protein
VGLIETERKLKQKADEGVKVKEKSSDGDRG